MAYVQRIPESEKKVLNLILKGRDREAIEAAKEMDNIKSVALMAQLILVYWYNRFLERSSVIWPDRLNELIVKLPQEMWARYKPKRSS